MPHVLEIPITSNALQQKETRIIIVNNYLIKHESPPSHVCHNGDANKKELTHRRTPAPPHQPHKNIIYKPINTSQRLNGHI